VIAFSSSRRGGEHLNQKGALTFSRRMSSRELHHLAGRVAASLMFSESLLNNLVIFIFDRFPTQFQHVTVVLSISGGSIKIEKWPHTESYAWSARCDGLGGETLQRCPIQTTSHKHTMYRNFVYNAVHSFANRGIHSLKNCRRSFINKT